MNSTYTIKDWMTALKISRTTLWRLIKDKTIPSPDRYIGQSPRWNQSTIDAFESIRSTNP